jgi:hypothetical protein
MKTFTQFLEQKINEQMDMPPEQPPAMVRQADNRNEKDEILKQKKLKYFNEKFQDLRPDGKEAIQYWVFDRDVSMENFKSIANRIEDLTRNNKCKFLTLDIGVAIKWFDKEKEKFVTSFAQSELKEFIKLLEKIIPSSPMKSNPMPSNIGDYLPKK